MAKIGAYGANTLCQFKGHKPDDSGITKDNLVHITLTVTTDGRVLRKISMRYKSSGNRTHYSNSNNKLVFRVPPEMREKGTDTIMAALTRQAARWGYEPD